MKVLAIIHHAVAGAGVFPEVVAERGHDLEFWTPSDEEIPRPLEQYGAVLAFGGGMHPDQDDAHPWLLTAVDALHTCLSARIPTLGVCLGGQLLARAGGGPVGPAQRPEVGWLPIELTEEGLNDPLFTGMPRSFEVYQWHAYQFGLPPEAVALARSEVSLQCFRIGACAWGVQWHPEVLGETILHWAVDYVPAPGGVRIEIDLDAVRAEVAARIDATNAGGQELCRRLLLVAEERAGQAN